MPLVGFLLLAVVCLALLGFACACLTDHPTQALDRALEALAALPALVEVWAGVLVASLAGAVAFAWRRRAIQPLSPAALQRFLL